MFLVRYQIQFMMCTIAEQVNNDIILNAHKI